MNTSLDDKIIEAARAEVVAVGLRRATMTAIARRAGLSRATLHRRAQSTHQLVLEALVSESTAVLQRAVLNTGFTRDATATTDVPGRCQLVAITTEAVRLLREDDLLNALLEHDPELLMPYLVERLGRSQEVVLELLESRIAAAQDDGSVRPGAPRALALAVLQAVTPFAIGHRLLHTTDADVDWAAEAGRLVDAYLAPATTEGSPR